MHTMLFSEVPEKDRIISAILGYGVCVLILLAVALITFLVIKKIRSLKNSKNISDNTEHAASDTLPAHADMASGTAGQVKLYDVDPKVAAMLMAIVAEKTGKPLNELRFISIKQVKK